MVRSVDDHALDLTAPPGDGEAPPDGDGHGGGNGDGPHDGWPEPAPADEADLASQRRSIRRWVDLVVVGACVAFVLWHLQPDLLLRNTTPAGGDMGAHVWGPAYLRDHLLPHGQVAGWSPDWYAGFPAYQFYMVLPSLLIVWLNVGIHGPLAVVPAALCLGLVALAVARRRERRVCLALAAGAVLAFSFVGLPYGVAFKLITVSGVATLPVAAYLFGRLGGLRYPTPAVLAVFSLPFLFYRGFTIYGGNIPSTLAGEFAFSMSLSFALVYLGVVMRGLQTGRHRALAAGLLALTGLCHLIPAFWALSVTGIIVLVRFRRSTAPALPAVGLMAGGGLAVVAGKVLGAPAGPGLVLAALGLVAGVAGLWLLSESVRWLTPTLVVGGLLAAFWVGPFYLRRAFLNDMGWEKLPYTNADPPETIWKYLVPSKTPDVDIRWVLALALVGAGLAIALRLRAGIVLAAATLMFGVVFVIMPEGRLWNGRLLPFYYLTAFLLAGLAISETAKTVMVLAREGRHAPPGVGTPVALGALAAIVVLVGVPLGQLPFTEKGANANAWPRFSPLQIHAGPVSFVPSWARWNYTGYEGKDAYREYFDVVQTMKQVGQDRGCGRTFWEYQKELDRYGTPMALMLLPFWTDGCIGSMEGLYFEASATTPFHFLTQTELSTAPSAAQRDLPYGSFDITKGVEHLQMLGVKYYMATSPNAVSQARTNPDLKEIAVSGPWVVFEVANSEIVTPLKNEPAVVTGVNDSQLQWVEKPLDESGHFGGPAIRWFDDATQWDVPLARSGPDDWQRVAVGDRPEARALPEVQVSNIKPGDESLSFDVDKIGTPVLVKMSYFPNWKVSGAEGPYRVAPNLMVVVPKTRHVTLTYGRTSVEYLSYTLTLLGLVGLVLLARRGRYHFTPPPVPPAFDAEADLAEQARLWGDPDQGQWPVGALPEPTGGAPPPSERAP
jgi:6-pyruvoyl-tetrahydropterin synthase related domain